MLEPNQNRQAEMWDRKEAGPLSSTPEERALEPPPEPRLKRVNRQQLLLRPVDVERLVEPGHRVRAIWEGVGRMDRSRFQEPIEAVEGAAGRPAWDPQLLISWWIYAYRDGVRSAREVERRRGYHPAYQWLTGLEVVNHHTRSDFGCISSRPWTKGSPKGWRC